MRMTFTVAGATGRLRGLTPLLLEHGHRVRVLTRQTESPTARELRALGAEIRRGDFEDSQSLCDALEGADALFAAGTAHRAGPDGERRHGINAADAARQSGVPHFVYLSGSGARRHGGVPVFAAKHAVEQHIRSLPLAYTIVAPVYFMENLFNPWNAGALAAGVLPSPVGADRMLQQVAIRDVAAFARLALERPDEFSGRRVEIASDELTGAEAAAALARATGRRFELQEVSPKELPGGLAHLFSWLQEVGDSVDIAALHARYPQVGWQSFERWARAQHWRWRARGAA